MLYADGSNVSGDYSGNTICMMDKLKDIFTKFAMKVKSVKICG